MKKRVLLLIGGVLLVSFFVYYRSAKEILWGTKENENGGGKNEEATNTRDLSAEVEYSAPDGEWSDHLRFVVTIDKAGSIQSIQTLDAKTGKTPPKKEEFNTLVNASLKGKKLSELTAIDKVGKSSMTTTAFNKALIDLKAQI